MLISNGESFTKNFQSIRETVCINTVIGNGRTSSILSYKGLELTADSKNSWSQKSKKNPKYYQRLLLDVFSLQESVIQGQHRLDEPDNGHFLGIIELLAKYDNILYDHLQNIREHQ